MCGIKQDVLDIYIFIYDCTLASTIIYNKVIQEYHVNSHGLSIKKTDHCQTWLQSSHILESIRLMFAMM